MRYLALQHGRWPSGADSSGDHFAAKASYRHTSARELLAEPKAERVSCVVHKRGLAPRAIRLMTGCDVRRKHHVNTTSAPAYNNRRISSLPRPRHRRHHQISPDNITMSASTSDTDAYRCFPSLDQAIRRAMTTFFGRKSVSCRHVRFEVDNAQRLLVAPSLRGIASHFPSGERMG